MIKKFDSPDFPNSSNVPYHGDQGAHIQVVAPTTEELRIAETLGRSSEQTVVTRYGGDEGIRFTALGAPDLHANAAESQGSDRGGFVARALHKAAAIVRNNLGKPA